MPYRALAAALCAACLVMPARAQTCTASFYGTGEKLNHHTANGEVFRPYGLTAAHRSLKFGTRIRVTRGKRSVIVRVTDRGPAAWTGRCLDLSAGAAKTLDMLGAGVSAVHITIIK